MFVNVITNVINVFQDKADSVLYVTYNFNILCIMKLMNIKYVCLYALKDMKRKEILTKTENTNVYVPLKTVKK